MKCHKGVRREAGHSTARWRRQLAVLCWLAFAGKVAAQGVLAPPTTFSGNMPGPLVPGPTDIGALGDDSGPTLFGNSGILQWGPVHLHPHFFYRLSYSDGLQASAGNPSKTVIQSFTPGVTLQVGNKWTLDYSPSIMFYSDPKFKDTVGQSVSFSGATDYEDWSFRLSQRYSASTQPLVETGAQTAQESYGTTLGARYRMNSQTSLELGINQNFRFTESFTDSKRWSSMNWLNYEFWPRFSGALGAGVTYDEVSLGADMLSEQFRGRLNLGIGKKINVTFSTGIEVRQVFDSTSPASPINPVFSLSGRYQIFEQTSLTIKGSRQTSASLFRNQITENTDVNVGVSQRLLERLMLTLGAGYRLSDFQATSSAVVASRQDTTTHFSARLSAPIKHRITTSIFYQYSKNSSSAGGFGYSSNESGFELSYNF